MDLYVILSRLAALVVEADLAVRDEAEGRLVDAVERIHDEADRLVALVRSW